MTAENFNSSLSENAAPTELTELQLALWYAGRGEWDKAHNMAQQHEGQNDFDRLHAYLHRVEGDQWNAGYWYHRAGTKLPAVSIKEEFEMLVNLWI